MPPGSVTGVTVIAELVTFSVRLAAPVWPLASVTLTVKAKAPAAVGVPDTMPPGDSASPAGSAPPFNTKRYGPTPPAAVSVALYAAPAVATGRVVGVTVTSGAATVRL